MPDNRGRAVAVVTCVLLTAAACGSDGDDTTFAVERLAVEPTTLADPGPAPLPAVNCDHVVDEIAAPDDNRTVVLGDVAFETGRTLEVARAKGTEHPHRLFAKTGLVVRAGAVVDIRVEQAPDNGASVGWGSPGSPADHLRVPGCDARAPDMSWLAFAGGFWVDRPGCVTLTVRAHGEQTRVRIPVGATCRAGR